MASSRPLFVSVLFSLLIGYSNTMGMKCWARFSRRWWGGRIGPTQQRLRRRLLLNLLIYNAGYDSLEYSLLICSYISLYARTPSPKVTLIAIWMIHNENKTCSSMLHMRSEGVWGSCGGWGGCLETGRSDLGVRFDVSVLRFSVSILRK